MLKHTWITLNMLVLLFGVHQAVRSIVNTRFDQGLALDVLLAIMAGTIHALSQRHKNRLAITVAGGLGIFTLASGLDYDIGANLLILWGHASVAFAMLAKNWGLVKSPNGAVLAATPPTALLRASQQDSPQDGVLLDPTAPTSHRTKVPTMKDSRAFKTWRLLTKAPLVVGWTFVALSVGIIFWQVGTTSAGQSWGTSGETALVLVVLGLFFIFATKCILAVANRSPKAGVIASMVLPLGALVAASQVSGVPSFVAAALVLLYLIPGFGVLTENEWFPTRPIPTAPSSSSRELRSSKSS